jgi:hypothetical protein
VDERNDQPWKVNLGDKLGILNNAVAGAFERLREIGPNRDAHTSQTTSRARRRSKSVHRTKNHGENERSDQRLQHHPNPSERGSFVKKPDVALNQNAISSTLRDLYSGRFWVANRMTR